MSHTEGMSMPGLARAEVRLHYEDEGHGITRLPNRLDCYPRVAAFLQEHLL